jgi:hypothetical protein
VQGAVTYTTDNSPLLGRPVTGEVVASLEQAITLASLPSPMLAHIVRAVVANAVAELAAAARLREFVGARGAAALGGAGGGTSEAVAALTDALEAAEPFRTRLGSELDAAQELLGRWTQRAHALEKLEGAVEEVRTYTANRPLSFSLAGAAPVMAGPSPGSTSPSVFLSGRADDHRPGTGSPPGVSAAAVVAAVLGGQDGQGLAGRLEANGRTAGPAVAAAGGAGAAGEGGSAGGAAAAGGEVPQPPDLAEWDRRMRQLESAMNEAKDANISVTKVGGMA